MAHFKPTGYGSVSPHLIVAHAAATIRSLERVLEGKLLRSYPDADGLVIHAEVRIDDAVVMLAGSAPDWPPIPACAHVYVQDVGASYERAPAEGATSVQAPEKKGDADKRGGVKDPGGTTWWIATRIE